jgi:hypothetical protein
MPSMQEVQTARLRETRDEDRKYYIRLGIALLACLVVVGILLLPSVFRPRFETDESYVLSLLARHDPNVLSLNFSTQTIDGGQEKVALWVSPDLLAMQEVNIRIRPGSELGIKEAMIERFSFYNMTLEITTNRHFNCSEGFVDLAIGKLEDGTMYVGSITNIIPLELFFKDMTALPTVAFNESDAQKMQDYLRRTARLSQITYFSPSQSEAWETEVTETMAAIRQAGCVEIK